MTTTPIPITDNDLMAFVDGQLDDKRHDEIKAYLDAHPEKAEEVAAWRNQNDAIGALYNHIEKEPVPLHLSPLAIARSMRQRQQSSWRMAAAAVVLLTLGAGLGYGLRTVSPAPSGSTDQLIASAFAAHELFVDQRVHPVEVAAAEATHLSAWLSSNLGQTVATPDLSARGLSFVGGRLLPGIKTAAAQLMYERADGDRVTLYLTPRSQTDQDENKPAIHGELAALYWATETLTCTIVGDLEPSEMDLIATDVFSALAGSDPDYYRRG